MSLVLLVEDDVMLRASMARALHKLAGVDVVEAGTTDEAIQLVTGLPVDLLLCDLRLGDRTALEVLPHARRDGHTIPTILMSGCFGELKESVPPDLHLVEKPITSGALRELVAQLLGRPDRGAPFSLADYLQLASFGRHTVELSVSHSDGEHAGTVTVRDGQAWSAHDALGDGMNAFLRLVTIPNATLACTQSIDPTIARNLRGTCEGLLMEAAQIVDERRANRPVTQPTVTVPPAATPLVMRIPPKPPALAQGTVRQPRPAQAPAIPTPPPKAPTPAPPAKDARDFERLYEAGIDALLHKRYADARSLLNEAREIRSTPTLEANLQRLRTLGYV